MRDRDQGEAAVAGEFVEDPGLSRRVERTRRFVQDQHVRLPIQCARDGQALALTARKPDPVLADDRGVASGQAILDGVVDQRAFRCEFDCVLVDLIIGDAERDIARDAVVDQE